MKKILKNKDFLIVLFLLIVSAFLRIYRIADFMTFLGDEGRDVLVAYNILHGKLTLLGPTSSVGGFFLGPVYYYFMAPFLWLFHYDPVGPAIMVALFGVATVVLVYLIGKEFFGRIAGLVAAILYMISPLVLAYSRSSWNPNLMPFFTLITLYVVYKSLYKNKLWFMVLAGFLFGVCMQLHYVELFVGVIIAIYILLIIFLTKTKQKLTIAGCFVVLIKKYLLFFAGFILGFVPWLAFEIRHNFMNTQGIIKFILFSGDTGGSGNFIQKCFEMIFQVFARLLTVYPPIGKVPWQTLVANLPLTFFTLVIIVVSLGIFLFQRKILKTRDEKFYQYLLLFLWFFGGILIFGFYKKSIYDYYFEFIFPLPFLFLGNAFAYCLRKNIIIKFVATIFFCLLLFINLKALPFWFPANRQLAQAETIARFVNEKTDSKPFNFALITGGNSDHAYRYFFKLWGHDPVVIQNAVIDPSRKSVTKQLLVVCELLPCSPQGVSLWEVAGFGRADIAGKWDVSVVNVYKLVKYKGLQ